MALHSGTIANLRPRAPDAAIMWSVVAGIALMGGIFWLVGKLPSNVVTKPVKFGAKVAKGGK